MRPCFAFSAAAGTKPATLSIFEEIGFWGVQAKDFVAQLGAVSGKDLTVEINSPGGDVFAALTMYNSLRASGKTITTKVMGVAASAASLIFLAGDTRQMPKNTQLMAHNPWTFAQGNADELEETAATLRKIGSSIAGTYAARTGMSDEDVAAILGKDTWMTADEAIANGFATEVIEEVKVNAKFDLDRADLPQAVRAALGLVKAEDAPPGPTAEELAAAEEAERLAATLAASPVAQQINDLAVKTGLQDYAGVWAVACTDVAEAQARIENARQIVSICAFANKAEAAGALIKANKTIAEARAEIVAAMVAEDDESSVDTASRINNKQTASNSAKPAVTTASIWASHNAKTVKKGS